MSGGFSLLGDVCNAKAVGPSSNSLGTAVVTSATLHTKGSWTEIIAATAADCILVELQAFYDGTQTGSGVISVAVDIGIGAAGSEIVLIPDFAVSPAFIDGGLASIMLPLQIPAGTRIAARAAAHGNDIGGARTVNVSMTLFDGSYEASEGASGVDAVSLAVSFPWIGVQCTTNATANTKGSYAELIASTARDYLGFFVALDYYADSEVRVDIAIGASGSEQIIWPDRAFTMGCVNSHYTNAVSSFVPMKIPAGTRIAARCQARASGSKTIGVNFYGVY